MPDNDANEVFRAMVYEVREFFREAIRRRMRDPERVKALPHPLEPGVWYYHHQKYFFPPEPRSFEMWDTFSRNEVSGNVTGTMTIYVDGTPVWTMHYQGTFPSQLQAVVDFELLDVLQREPMRRSIGIMGGGGLPCVYIQSKNTGDFLDFTGRREFFNTLDEETYTPIGCLEFRSWSLVHEQELPKPVPRFNAHAVNA
ncbi:MAG: hypothetical protein WCV85_06590 [Patescibacteria group bacterium]|jgi:hypothetical protein